MARQFQFQAGPALRRIVDQYRAVLAERNVALLLSAGVISELGDWFNTVALISLAYHFGDGALGVGGMFAARMLTRLIFQGPAGTFVDRHAGRRLLFSSQLLMAAIASSFALLVFVPSLWLLYLLVILLEAVNCITRPAFMVELKAEAPAAQRSSANGALFASTTTAQLIGPLLGALVLGAFGTATVFVLNGLTFLGVAIAVSQLRGGLSAASNVGFREEDPNTPLAGRTDAAALGYSWLLRRWDLSLYMLVCLSLAVLVQAAITLFVVRTVSLALDDGGVGLFYAAVAAGSIAGSTVAGARIEHPAPLYPAAIASCLCAIALVAFGVVGSAVLSLVALVAAGFAWDFYEVVGLTYFQGTVPDALYARFLSVFLLALSAGGLVGALVGPTLEQVVGAGISLAVLAAPSLALALALGALSRIKQPEQRDHGNDVEGAGAMGCGL